MILSGAIAWYVSTVMNQPVAACEKLTFYEAGRVLYQTEVQGEKRAQFPRRRLEKLSYQIHYRQLPRSERRILFEVTLRETGYLYLLEEREIGKTSHEVFTFYVGTRQKQVQLEIEKCGDKERDKTAKNRSR